MVFHGWLIPLAVSLYLLGWTVLPLRTHGDDWLLVSGMRGVGAVLTSAAVWLIWWLA